MPRAKAIVVGCLLGLCLAGGAADAEEKRDSQAALREVQSLFRSRRPEDRVAAMQRLKDFPPLEGAKLTLQLGLGDDTPPVRRAAYQTLLTWKDDREVGEHLLKIAEKGRSKQSTLVPALMVLAASVQSEVRRDLDAFAARHLSGKDSVATLLAVADELGIQGDAVAEAALKNLTSWKQFGKVFAFRRAVVQGLIRCRQVEAIDALIDLLGKVYGEVQSDIILYLTGLTKMPYSDDVAAWKHWWLQRRQDFNFDQPAAKADEAALVPAGTVSYYGLTIRARRLVFVIDISSSMHGPRIERAKRELSNAISNLPRMNDFSIVAFDHQVSAWQRDLVPANPANKDAAMRYVAALQVRGATATCDALDAAFRYDAEAIYFLTDGEPTAGRVVSPPQIAELTTQANRLRRMSIYTIGIAPGVTDGVFDSFLKTLAEQNYGTYRRVDQ